MKEIQEFLNGNKKWCVVQGDCAEVLPEIKTAFAIVTDPPYGLGKKWGNGKASKKNSWKKAIRSMPGDWDSEINPIVESFPQMSKEVVIWGGNYYSLPPCRGLLVWDKCQPKEWVQSHGEVAWTNLDIPLRTFRMPQCVAYGNMNKRHPTQKPVPLMRWCIEFISCGLVVDPFCGSGSTGVAAIWEGKRFLGIEKRKDYVCLSRSRLYHAEFSKPGSSV